MLALSRKQGESIMIGNDIEISILEIKGEQIKIGISSVPVYRKEIYTQIQEANKETVNSLDIESLKKLL